MRHLHPSSTLYLWILLGPIVFVVLALVAIGLWLGPANGDLTRISKYSDRDFGSAGNEVWLTHTDSAIYKAPFGLANNWQLKGNILVFGDSFSDRRGGKLTWLDLVQHRLNASLHIVLPSDYADVSRYLESDSFKVNPPKAIVVETVERAFRSRALGFYSYAESSRDCALPDGRVPAASALFDTQRALPTVERSQQTDFENIHVLFDRSSGWVRKSFRPKKNRVVIANLSNAALFSNSRSNQILLYDEDLTKHRVRGLSAQELALEDQTIQCNLRKLVRSAGSVPLVFVMVPDKRTVYSSWIKTDLPVKESDLQAVLAASLGDLALDLTPVMRFAVQHGVQDVYAPNDSHWGIPGQHLAAEALLRRLTGKTLGQ